MTIALARYTRAGRLDLSFGDSGIVLRDIGTDDEVLALKLGPNNDIRVVVATTHATDERSCDVVAFLETGDDDTSFGQNGRISNPFFPGSIRPKIRAAAFDIPQPPIVVNPGLSRVTNQKTRIVAVGTVQADVTAESEHFAVARFILPGGVLSPGGLDPTFGNGGGVETFFFPVTSAATCVRVDRRGRVIVGGDAGESFAVARYRENGDLDSEWGGDGKVVTPVRIKEDEEDEEDGSTLIVPGHVDALAMRADGSVVVAGFAETLPGTTVTRFALCQYDPDGRLDSTFGLLGCVTNQMPGAGTDTKSRIRTVTHDGQGRIVAVGDSANRRHFAIARYRRDGRLDRALNRDGDEPGKVITTFGGSQTYAKAVWIDETTETITVVGSASKQFALARYVEDGLPDNTFGDDNGRLRTVVAPEPNRAEAVAVVVDEQGRTVVAGNVRHD